jgi:hypothetical protein
MHKNKNQLHKQIGELSTTKKQANWRNKLEKNSIHRVISVDEILTYHQKMNKLVAENIKLYKTNKFASIKILRFYF